MARVSTKENKNIYQLIMGQSAPKLHAACSSLRFEPIVDDVEWRVVFSEKLMDDVDVDLI